MVQVVFVSRRTAFIAAPEDAGTLRHRLQIRADKGKGSSVGGMDYQFLSQMSALIRRIEQPDHTFGQQAAAYGKIGRRPIKIEGLGIDLKMRAPFAGVLIHVHVSPGSTEIRACAMTCLWDEFIKTLGKCGRPPEPDDSR